MISKSELKKKKECEERQLLITAEKAARAHGYNLLGMIDADLCLIAKYQYTSTGVKSGIIGLMRTDGSMIFEPQFTEYSTADKGMLMLLREDGKWGVVAKSGEPVTDFKYDEMDGRYEFGRLLVKYNGLYGYINKKGKEVIPFQFEKATPFWKGKAIVRKSEKLFAINIKGEEVESDIPLSEIHW